MSDPALSASVDKPALYREILEQVVSVVKGLEDPIATMASAACLIHQALPYASWTGFYRVVDPGLLRIGPYQGPLGCLEIPFGEGVCGAVAKSGRSLVVPDVHAFPGHIACDSAARAEIVVPVLDARGSLTAVLDVDSHAPAAFDEDDRAGLEAIAKSLRPHV